MPARIPLAILAAASLLACQEVPSLDQRAHAGFYVEGGFLRAPDGRAAILRGSNMSGQQKWAPYLDANGAEDYLKLRTVFAMNAIRFVMTWAAVEPMPDRYDDAYLDAVAQRLGWAQAAGLSVILDMHQDVFGEGFGFDGAPRWACDEARYRAFLPREPWFLSNIDPNVQACFDKFYTDAAIQSRFVAAWQHVAARLSGSAAVIGFDVLNEPGWGTYAPFDFEHDRLTPLYLQVVSAVRSAAPHWVAFLEPAATRNLGLSTGLAPFPFPDVMYAPHSYDPRAESGDDFNPAQRATILDNFIALAEEATALRAGLWIGEYGGVTTRPSYADYMRAEYDGAGAVAASTMYWDHSRGEGYSMLDTDGTPRAAALAALVRPYPERVAGTPRSYAFDEQTGSFRFRYRSAAGARADTEIVVPDRLFPSGYHLECGGCGAQKEPGRLRITDVPPDAEVEIVLSR